MLNNFTFRLCTLIFFLVNVKTVRSGSNEKVQNGISKNLQNYPILFRQNVGQWDNTILYKGSSLGWNASVNFKNNGLSFGFSRTAEEDIAYTE